METAEKIARYKEIERRGLLDKLPPEKQAAWAEVKKRGLDGQEPQSPYGAGDKVKYGLRAAAEGLTFDLGDIAAGATNIIAKPLGTLSGAAFGGGKVSASDFNPVRSFKEGRRDFINEQNEFKKYHPALNFGGELTGGLITGGFGAGKKIAQTAAKQGIKQLAKQGVKEGAKFGAAYGAGSGLTEDPEKLSVPGALFGAGTGALAGGVLGGVLPVPFYGIGKAIRGFKPSKTVNAATTKNAALQRLINKNSELVKESVETNTPLINIADKKLFRTARGAVSADSEAEQIFSNYANKFNAEKAGKVEDLINRQLGNKSSYGVMEDIINAGKKKYQPIYEEVMQAGDLQIPVKNQRILNAMQEVAREYPELKNISATDIRFLDLVKQKLDDKIGVAMRAGENNKARVLMNAKKDLVSQIDAKLPRYAEARKAFKEMKDLEELVARSQQVKTLSRDELAQLYSKTAPEERGAIKAGIRDILIRDLDRINSEGANAVKKVFSNSMINKLKRIGLSEQDIINEINRENFANANIQGVFAGSNTAQKIADILNHTESEPSVGRAIFYPMRTAKKYGIKGVDYLFNQIRNSKPGEVARLMTDPQYLKAEYMRLNNNTPQKVQGISVSDILNGAKGTVSNSKGYLSLGGGGKGSKPKIKDLTKHYNNFSKLPKATREKIIDAKLNNMVGNPIDTDTPPYQMQIIPEKIGHITNSNIVLNKGKTLRNQAALLALKKIVNRAKQDISRDGTVDLTHNAPATAQRKANEVAKYVYFDRPVKIGNDDFTVKMSTEQIKGQRPDLLDLYHINVKRNITRSSGPNVPLSNTIPNKPKNVNPKIKQIVKNNKGGK